MNIVSSSLSVTDVKLFNYLASISYDSSKNMEENIGEVKSLPGLPVCKFRGESIPGFMCMSPKGSIISDILNEVLKYVGIQLYTTFGKDRLNQVQRTHDISQTENIITHIRWSKCRWEAAIRAPHSIKR